MAWKLREGLTDAQKRIWTFSANAALKKFSEAKVNNPDDYATQHANAVLKLYNIIETITYVEEVGKSISTLNKSKLKDAHASMQTATTHISDAMGHLSSMMDDAVDPTSESESELRNPLLDIEHPVTEAGKVLAKDDSFDAVRCAVSSALRTRAMQQMATDKLVAMADGDDIGDMYDSYYSMMPYIRDMYPDMVVYNLSGQLYQCTYTQNADDSITLGDPISVEISYVPAPAEAAEDVDESKIVTATFEGELIQLTERAVADDGTARIKLISPGWGSSGYYSENMLKRDGPKVFPKGLHMYINHPTAEEELSRPERDVRDLAGVLESEATWEDKGATGPGLYATARVFDTYKGFIDQAAPYIGTSIRAAGRATEGAVDGRVGSIIEGLVEGYSCDFVTLPGRGGEVLPLLEAARTRNFKVAEASKKEDFVNEEQIKALVESNKRIEAALSESQNELSRMKEAMLLRDARDVVIGTLAGIELPDVTRARLVESCSKNPPIKDGVLDKETLVETTKAVAVEEMKYLQTAAGFGKPVNVGEAAASEIKEEDIDAIMSESFADMGFSSNVVKMAVNGRKG